MVQVLDELLGGAVGKTTKTPAKSTNTTTKTNTNTSSNTKTTSSSTSTSTTNTQSGSIVSKSKAVSAFEPDKPVLKTGREVKTETPNTETNKRVEPPYKNTTNIIDDAKAWWKENFNDISTISNTMKREGWDVSGTESLAREELQEKENREKYKERTDRYKAEHADDIKEIVNSIYNPDGSVKDQEHLDFLDKGQSEIYETAKAKDAELMESFNQYEKMWTDAERDAFDAEKKANDAIIERYQNWEKEIEVLSNLGTIDAIREKGSDKDIENMERQVGANYNTLGERIGLALVTLPTEMLSNAYTAIDIAKQGYSNAVINAEKTNLAKALYDGQISQEKYDEEIAKRDILLEEKKKLYNDPDNISTELRQFSSSLKQQTYVGLNDVEKMLLQGGYSTAQFLLHFYLFGGLSGATNLVSGAMSAGAGIQATTELLDEGYDLDTALLNGMAKATISYFVEKRGADRLAGLLTGEGISTIIGGVGLKLADYGRELIQQGVSEGLEEVIEGWLDSTWDAVQLGKEFDVSDTGMAFMSAFVSGMLMGAPMMVSVAINSKAKYNEASQYIQKFQQAMAIENNELARAQMQVMIDALESARSEYEAKSKTGMAVDTEADHVAVPSNEEELMALRQAIIPDVNNAVEYYRGMYETEQQAKTFLSRELAQKGINARVDDYVNWSEEAKTNAEKLNGLIQDIAPHVMTVFDSNMEENGFVSFTKGGQLVLRINPMSEIAPTVTAVHELIHTIEGTEEYREILKTAFEGGFNLSRAVENLRQVYEGESEAGLVREAVAKKVSEEILNSEETLEHLARYNTSFAYKLYYKLRQSIPFLADNSATGKILKSLTNALSRSDYVFLENGKAYSKSNVPSQIQEFINDPDNALIHNGVKMNPLLRTDGYRWQKSRDIAPAIVDRDGLQSAIDGQPHGIHHAHNPISTDVLEKLDWYLDNPLFVMESTQYNRKGVYVVALQAKDSQGYPIIAVLSPNSRAIAHGFKNDYYDVELNPKSEATNYVETLYGKDRTRFFYDNNGDKYITPRGQSLLANFFSNHANAIDEYGQSITMQEAEKRFTDFLLSKGDGIDPSQTDWYDMRNELVELMEFSDNDAYSDISDDDRRKLAETLVNKYLGGEDITDTILDIDPYYFKQESKGKTLKQLEQERVESENAYKTSDGKTIDEVKAWAHSPEIVAKYEGVYDGIVNSKTTNEKYRDFYELDKEATKSKPLWDKSQKKMVKEAIQLTGFDTAPFMSESYTQYGNSIIDPNAKSIKRAVEKVIGKLGTTDDWGNPYSLSSIKDQNRLTVQVTDLNDIPDIVSKFKKKYGAKLEVFDGDSEFGYTGFHLTWQDSKGIRHEVQVSPNFDVKQESELIYAKWRAIDKETMTEEQKASRKQDADYSKSLWASLGITPDVISRIRSLETDLGVNGTLANAGVGSTQDLDLRSNIDNTSNPSLSNNVGVSSSMTMDSPLDSFTYAPPSNNIVAQSTTNMEEENNLTANLERASETPNSAVANRPLSLSTQTEDTSSRGVLNSAQDTPDVSTLVTPEQLVQYDLPPEYLRTATELYRQATDPQLPADRRTMLLSTYQSLISAYGAIPAGARPRRNDSLVPRYTDTGKVSQTVRTILETPDLIRGEQRDDIRVAVAEGLANYEQFSVGQINDEASHKMRRLGTDNMFDSFMADGSLLGTPQRIADGYALLKRMSKTKDSRIVDVVIQLNKLESLAGQTLRSGGMYKELSPATKLMVIQKQVDEINKMNSKRIGTGAEQISIPPEIATEFVDPNITETQRKKVEEKLLNYLYNKAPNTLLDKINTWRHLSMLGNPRTHIRNILGNAMFVPVVSTKNAIGAGLESAYQKIVNSAVEKETSRLNNKYVDLVNNASGEELAKGKRDIDRKLNRLKNLKMDERTKKLTVDKELINFGQGQYDKRKNLRDKADFKWAVENNILGRGAWSNKWIVGKGVNLASDFNSKLLETEDNFFKRQRYAWSMAEWMSSNNVTPSSISKEQLKKADEYAYQECLKATYNDANALADAIGKLAKKNGAFRFAKDAVIPYTRTPFNIVRRGVEYSPAGLVYTLTKGARDLQAGKITANDFIDHMASGLTGSGVVLLGVLLRSLGILRTKDDDPDRKQAFDETLGEQDYSLVFGDKSYTIDWAEPVIMPLAMGAEAYNAIYDFDGWTSAGTAVSALIDVFAKVGDPIIETSMLSSLQSALKSYANGGGEWLGDMVTNAVQSYVSQLFPTIGGQLARTVDPIRRTTYPNEGIVDKTLRQIRNKIPKLSENNEPFLNAKGEDVEVEDLDRGAVGRLLLNMFSPAYVATQEMSKNDKELYRLYDATGDVSAFPNSTKTSFSYNSVKYDLTGDEYTKFNRNMLSMENKYVTEFMSSSEYRSLNDNERIKIISDIREFCYKEAKAEYLKGKGITYVERDIYMPANFGDAQGIVNKGYSLSDFFLANEFHKNNKSDTKQADFVDYLNSTNMSEEEKNYMYDTQYGESKFIGHVNNMNLTDEQKYAIKEAYARQQTTDDFALLLEEAGVYDAVVKYCNDNKIEYSAVGLNKTIVKNGGGNPSKRQKETTSTTSSSQPTQSYSQDTSVSLDELLGGVTSNNSSSNSSSNSSGYSNGQSVSLEQLFGR